MVKIVTAQEIRDYVLAQPDDRPIDNYNPNSEDGCGCVMVNYGRDILKLKKFGCGFQSWTGEKRITLEIGIDEIFEAMGWNGFCEAKTFGELKKYCK